MIAPNFILETICSKPLTELNNKSHLFPSHLTAQSKQKRVSFMLTALLLAAGSLPLELYLLFLCMCSWMYACGVWKCMHVEAIGPCQVPYFLKRGLPVNLELLNPGSLAGQQAPDILLFSPQGWDYRYILSTRLLYRDPRAANSALGLHRSILSLSPLLAPSSLFTSGTRSTMMKPRLWISVLLKT